MSYLEVLNLGLYPPAAFRDAKAVAARAAINDQEAAGVNIISDGELFRRDDNRFGPPNATINYFTAKIPGCDVIQIDEPILWLRTEDQKWGVKAINA